MQERLTCLPTGVSAVYEVEKAIQIVNQVLAEYADESAPKRQRRPRIAKLTARTPHMCSAITSKKKSSTYGK